MNTIEMVLPGVGEPETLQARTRELAPPAPGQALVRMEASGVSFAERSMRRGKYYDQPAFPFVPGYDLVGVVEAMGDGAGGDGAGGDGAGHRLRPRRFRAELRDDLTALFGMLADSTLTAPVDRTFPLSEAAAALRHAEAGGLSGKVIIVPDTSA